MNQTPRALSHAPDGATRWAPWMLLVMLLCAAALLSVIDDGWIGHDEGALGQSAERVLNGEVPHRDFDELYTGLLSYINAAAFKALGVSAMAMRWPLFILAVFWAAALFALLRRFLSNGAAAFVALTAFAWSVPQYPAAMPSWYNLFLATFGTLALVRWHESGLRRWLFLAGAAGGISFLFKLSGVFYLLGGGLALVTASRGLARPSVNTQGRLAATVLSLLLALLFVGLAIPIVSAGLNEAVRLALPLALVIGAIASREWTSAAVTLPARLRALGQLLWPFACGAAIPILLFAVAFVSAGALEDAVRGVLLTPFRRVQSAAMSPPSPLWNASTLALGALLFPRAAGRTRGWVVGAIAVALVLTVGLGSSRQAFQDIGWYAAWGLPLLTAAAVGLRLHFGVKGEPRSMANAACTIALVATCALLVEFPFAARIYTCYALPLSMVALAALAGMERQTPHVLQRLGTAALLAFGTIAAMPISSDGLSRILRRGGEAARLELARAHLRGNARGTHRYAEMIPFVTAKGERRRLWAGPDAPEVYFFSGHRNHTRTLFDFLDTDVADNVAVADRALRTDPEIVVLRLAPSFSHAPTPRDIERLRRMLPNERTFDGFLVLWRESSR